MTHILGRPDFLSATQLAEYQTGFEPFAGAADQIAADLARVREAHGEDSERVAYPRDYNGSDHYLRGVEGYLGAGVQKAAFRAVGTDGRPGVIKFLYVNTPQFLHNNIEPLVRGARQDDNLEQLIGLEPDRGIMVTTPAPGTGIRKLGLGELTCRLTATHIGKMARTLATMRRLGLHPHSPDGVFLDDDSGIHITDYAMDSAPGNWGSIETAEDWTEWMLHDFDEYDRRLGSIVEHKYEQVRPPTYGGILGMRRNKLIACAGLWDRVLSRAASAGDSSPPPPESCL